MLVEGAQCRLKISENQLAVLDEYIASYLGIAPSTPSTADI